MEKNISKTTIDIAIIAVISLFSFKLFSRFDVLEKIVELSSEYESYEIDEILPTFIVLVFCLAWFSIRRWRETLKTKNIIVQKTKSFKTPLMKLSN